VEGSSRRAWEETSLAQKRRTGEEAPARLRVRLLLGESPPPSIPAAEGEDEDDDDEESDTCNSVTTSPSHF
jgi:hypothetical protein